MSLNSTNTTTNQSMKTCGTNVQLILTETSKPHDENRTQVKYELQGATLLIDATKVVVQSASDAPQLPPVVAFKLDNVNFSSLEIPMTNILKVQLTQPWFGPNSVDIAFVAIPKAAKGLHLVPSHSRDGTTWKAALYFREGGAIEFQKVLAEKHTQFRQGVQRQQGGGGEEGLPGYEAAATGAPAAASASESMPPAYVE